MGRVKAFDYHPVFNKTTLANGIRVLTEHHPFTRSVSAGVYVDIGTRDEPVRLNGVAHFIEHLVFKGTRKRTAFDIAKSLEEVGGDLNAYTSREYTCFHAECLREHTPLAMDVLADLISRAEFSKADFDLERDVVISEIDMSKDDFEEYIFDLYFEEVYRGHQLGRPILGTPETLWYMNRKKVMDYYQSRYCGTNLIVSVAGNVDHEDVVRIVEKALGHLPRRVPPRPRKRPRSKPVRRFVHRPSEQVHVLMGFPSGSFKDRHRFEAYIVHGLLGGGMTSKLYQTIRERRGLAYSVYSYLISFTDCGLLAIYASTARHNAGSVVKLIKRQIKDLREKGISRRDLKMYKTQVKGQILLAADDVDNRMNSLAINEMVFGEYKPVDDVVAEMDKVSVDSVQAYLDRYLNSDKVGLLILGDLEEDEAERIMGED